MPVVPLQIATADEILVAQLFAPQAPVPGAARELNSGALLMYDGRVGGPDAAGVVAHAFRLEFGTPNVAAVAANWLWSRLHGHAAEVRVAGAEVRLHHAALKAAMLAAAGEPQPL
jgi:hypothetical protein